MKVFLKAYAELEKDTPGQIFGITFKSDGKSDSSDSSSENISEKLTQRPKDEDTSYEEHDIKDTHEYKANVLGPRFFFALGIMISFALILYSLPNKIDENVNYERDRVLAERQRAQQENRQKSPFDEA